MNCPKCNNELRISSEQVGVDEVGLPVYHRFAYCDTCMTKQDIDVAPLKENSQKYIDITNEALQSELQVDSQTRLAREELQNDELDGDINSLYILAVMFSIMGIVCLIFTAYAGLFMWGLLLTPLAFLLSVYFCLQGDRKKSYKNNLELIAEGRKIINVCPKCKSSNIVMSMVQSEGYTTHDITKVSKNLNQAKN